MGGDAATLAALIARIQQLERDRDQQGREIVALRRAFAALTGEVEEIVTTSPIDTRVEPDDGPRPPRRMRSSAPALAAQAEAAMRVEHARGRLAELDLDLVKLGQSINTAARATIAIDDEAESAAQGDSEDV